jgi:hypothetical protein
MKPLVNTLGALIATVLTIAAVYFGTEALGSQIGAKGMVGAWAAAPQTQAYVCQQTSCSAKTCHIVSGKHMNARADNMNRCPWTGCEASTCHGYNHEPPPPDPRMERKLRHWRRYYKQSGPAAN